MRIRGIVAGGLCLAATGGFAAILFAQGALAGLGVQESQAKRDIVDALTYGNVDVHPARGAFKAAAPAARAALVKTAMTWARAYTESPAFRTEYEQQRAQAAPRPPKNRNVDDELARQKADRLKGIEDAKKNVEKMPANMRAQMETMIRQMEAENAKRDADPKFAAMMRQGLEMQIAAELKEHQESVARHQKRFPADSKVLIAGRLREFLEVSKDVDFGAKLVPAGPRQRFENPAYEAKSSNWKLCYRAGRDAVGSAREFAQAWVAALDGK